MREKIMWWWIKGSTVFVLFSFVILFTGQPPMVTATGSLFVNWVLHFLIAVSPVGALVGYVTLWVLALLFDLLLSMIGMERGTVTKVAKWTPASRTSTSTGTVIELHDGALHSKLGGTKLVVESNNYVRVNDFGGERVGKIEGSIFRDMKGDIIGHFDENGVLRGGQPSVMADETGADSGGPAIGEVKR